MMGLKDDDQLTIKSDTHELVLHINRIGLTLHKLIIRNYQADGHERDILSGPESSQGLQTEGRKFINPVVGRYANRLPAGHQVQVYDINLKNSSDTKITLDLENNEPCKSNPGRGNCLHGGKDGYDLREFKRVSENSDIVNQFRSISNLDGKAPTEQATQKACAYYHLCSQSGEQGFPESIDILATITLEILTSTSSKTDNKKLSRIGRARFDLKAKLSHSSHQSITGDEKRMNIGGTPINLTWHNGYILNDFKAINPDQPGIHQHKLWINSNDYLEIDNCQLPTGEIKSIDSQGIDFGTLSSCEEREEVMKTISETMPISGFDHCFLFKRPTTANQKEEMDDETNCKVILLSPKNDLELRMYTNQDSVQCYSANYFDGLGTRKDLHRNSSLVTQSGYNKHESIYLEFQQPSSLCTNVKLQEKFKSFIINGGNAVDNQDNKNETLKFCNYTTILYPNQVYQNWFFIDFFI